MLQDLISPDANDSLGGDLRGQKQKGGGVMPKLNKEQRKARDDRRLRERVEQRRKSGEDVVAYALANGKAYRFLSSSQ